MRATALNAAYYLFAYFQPHTTPFRTVYLFVTAELRTVCSLFSHIICNNLHLHIPTAVMATKGKQEIQGGSGEGRAGHARTGKKPAEANRVNLWLFWLLTAKGVCLI